MSTSLTAARAAPHMTARSIEGAADVEDEQLTVLVVDDDPGVLQLVAIALSSDGFKVTKATNGEEALKQAAETTPDAIVLDLEMPVMDGRACYRALRERGLTAPVLILSAHGARKARSELGAEDAVEKPFDPQVLSDRVRSLTNRHGRRD
jgi:DNA-binding response OmpR family regulator